MQILFLLAVLHSIKTHFCMISSGILKKSLLTGNIAAIYKQTGIVASLSTDDIG